MKAIMTATVSQLGNLSKGQDMQEIIFKHPHVNINLIILADVSSYRAKHSDYDILNAAYLKMGEQVVQITDREILAEIMASKGYFASIESVDNYESEAYA